MQKKTPKVSIVIPVYNGANYMRQAIDSAVFQDYQNIEILVINDGSKDNGETERIALSYGDKIRYFKKENGGVASALNLGIEKMTGDYFSWLSHDDVYHPEKVTVQVEELVKSGSGDSVIYSDYEFINSGGQTIEEIKLPEIDPCQILYYILMQSIHGCTLLIPRKAFKVVGGFPEDLPTTQDYTLFLRLTEYFTFVHCHKVLVQGRLHDEQGCRTMGHHGEVNEFYKREIERLSKEKMSEMFVDEEFVQAWVNITVYFKKLGYYDCFEIVKRDALLSLDAEDRKKYMDALTTVENSFLNQTFIKKVKNAIKAFLP